MQFSLHGSAQTKTAGALGLTISLPLLGRADEALDFAR
jgi:hypothetical protein